MSNYMLLQTSIQDKIYTIRGSQVLLDSDLAKLYGVETRRLNEQVKRNSKRFPEHFMFQLTAAEYSILRSQIAILEKGRHRKYLPYAFTEQGVAMLSSILKSEQAIVISIQIMEAFVTMRRFIQSNSNLFQRVHSIEQKHIEFQILTDLKFEKVFKAIEDKSVTPTKGIFFEGQVFDAYAFVSQLITSASKSIVLIDNYIDETVLVMLAKRQKGVSCTIYTENTKDQLKLDLAKHNTQYPEIILKKFKKSHDRFLILDERKVYHIGASLKDLGKKWFAFSQFDKTAVEMLGKLE